jgi:6-phosphogluconolactonase
MAQGGVGRREGMALPRNVVVTGSRDLPTRVAEWIAAELGRAVAARGSASLALAGGSTPRAVYAELTRPEVTGSLDWARVDVYFGDERAVPPDHAESNYAMAQATLLARVPIPPERVHRMEAERLDREQAAADYARLLPRHLDVLLLGMGPDGHTASLFPHAPVLKERERTVVPVIGPKPPPERMTITPPVIAAARAVAVIVMGAEKAATVARALEGPLDPRELPVQLARQGMWFLDPPAAQGLAGRT